MSAMVGEWVTTKFIEVALTYWNVPLRTPVFGGLTITTPPDEVLVKPVPVRATTVPMAAPTARAAGDADTIDGPSTVNALASEPMLPAVAAVLSRFAVCGPANEPVFTWIGHVNDVPALFAMQPVPTRAAASAALVAPYVEVVGVVYGLKPTPVKVIVVDGAPATRAAPVLRLDAVMLGASKEPLPIPIAPVAVYDAPLPPVPLFVTVRLHCVAVVPVGTATEAVMVDELVTEAPLSVTPAQVPSANVAPD